MAITVAQYIINLLFFFFSLPARPADTNHRPRGGPLRHRDPGAPRRHPPGHAHRSRWGGEDAPGARGGAVARGRVPGRRLVCFAGCHRERRARCECDRTGRGRHATRAGNAQAAVERFLGPKVALLVLDNFEHLLPAAPLISDLLVSAPALAVIATSRRSPATGRGAALLRRSTTSPRRGRPRSRRASRGRGAIRRARPPPRPRLRADRRQRRRGRGDLPPPRRTATRHRARRRPHHPALRPRAKRPPRTGAGLAGNRAARRARPPAHPAGHDRLEPPPTERPGGHGLRSFRRVCRRGHHRGRRGVTAPTSTRCRDWSTSSCCCAAAAPAQRHGL